MRHWREERELSQAGLADAVGVTRQSIANIERGEQNIVATNIGAFCRALKVTADELLELKDTKINVQRADWKARAMRAEKTIRAAKAALTGGADK